jgi:hypothetical protein
MTDPKAWAKGLSRDRLGVLEAGRNLPVPAATKQAVWTALAAKLPAAATTGAGGAAAHGIAKLSLTKFLAVGVALGAAGAAGIAGYRQLTTEAPAPAPAVSTRSAPASISSAGATLVAGPDQSDHAGPAPAEPIPALPTARSPASPHPGERAQPRANASAPTHVEAPVSPTESATLVESRRLAAARASWRAGDARTALRELESLQRDFPHGILGQERDALRIQALAAIGQQARARELARGFLEQYRDSPHADAVRQVLR